MATSSDRAITSFTPDQIAFVRSCAGRWLDLAADYNKRQEGRPTSADAWHSSLLERLLSGRRVFDKPPPLAYSYPWYELVENGRYEGVCSVGIYEDGVPILESRRPAVSLCQSIWWLISKDGDTYELEYAGGNWRARLTVGAVRSGEHRECVVELMDDPR